MSESQLLTGSMEEGQGCPCPQKKKQMLNNYQSVSFVLPICSKPFGKKHFWYKFSIVDWKKIRQSKSARLHVWRFLLHHLISATHEISVSFDANASLEVRAEFLDISEGFDQVWHECLVYKI